MCVKGVEERGGFALLRDACDGEPFSNFPNVKKIANLVGEIDAVKASGSKFSECPI